MLNDLLLFIINGGGWAIKPILEKVSVDRIGYYYFTFLRYVICGVISLPFLIHFFILFVQNSRFKKFFCN